MSLEDTIRAAVREEVRAALAECLPADKWEGCLTLKHAGKLADVSVSTLEKWGREGLRILKRGHVRRVDVAELRAFMAARESGTKQDAKDFARQLLGKAG